MLYGALAAVLIASLAGLILPLLARRSRNAQGLGPRDIGRRDGDLAVYRDQLEELERETERGRVAPGEAATLRAEIGRRLLRADSGEDEAATTISARGQMLLAVCIGLGVSLAGVGLYVVLGSPGVPDAPFAERFNDPDALSEIPVEILVDVMADRLEGKPDDIAGWTLLGQVATRLSRFDLSARAFENLVRLRPGDAEVYVQLGQARVGLSRGLVGEDARLAFERALVLDAAHPAPQYYLGLVDFQAGRNQAAYDRWTALAAQTPDDAPWRDALLVGLRQSGEALGLKRAQSGPSAEDIEAARAMSDEGRASMIRTMVEGLAAKLEANRDDLAGWQRLARAYEVLGENDKRLQAFENIIRLDPENPQALEVLGEAAAQAGKSQKAAAYWQILLAQHPKNSKEYQILKKKMGRLRPR